MARVGLVLLTLVACSALTQHSVVASAEHAAIADATACDTCKWASRIVEDAMCDVEVNERLIVFVQERVCPLSGLGEQCEQLAETLVPVAIEWLRNSATPSMLCSSVGVCGSAIISPVMQAIHDRRMARMAARESMGCSVCEYLVRTVKTEVDNPAALEKIKQKALQACTTLPPELAASCTDLVTNYADIIIAAINGLDPKNSCVSVGLCAGAMLSRVRLAPLPPVLVGGLSTLRAAVARPIPGTVGAPTTCDICRITVLEMHTLVANPDIQGTITNYTKTLCDSLGASNAATCKVYVDVYGPLVFNMLQSYLQPDPVCQGLSLCDKPAPPPRTTPAGGKPKALLPGRSLDLKWQLAKLGAIAKSRLLDQAGVAPTGTADAHVAHAVASAAHPGQPARAARVEQAASGGASGDLRQMAALMSGTLDVLGRGEEGVQALVDELLAQQGGTAGDAGDGQAAQAQEQDAAAGVQPLLGSLLPALLDAAESALRSEAAAAHQDTAGSGVKVTVRTPTRKLRA